MTSKPFAWLSLAAAGVGALTAAVFFSFTVDDAFIVLRYARHLVKDGQLAFNLGEPVMAFTSPLHAMLMAAFTAVAEGHVLLLNKIAMALCVALSAWLLVRKHPGGAQARAIVLVLLAGSPFVWMWAVGGLETMLVALLVTALAVLQKREDDPRAASAMAALAGVAFLARYDTVFFVLPVLGGLWWRVWHREGRAAAIKGMAIAAVLPALWMIFSIYYFHDVFPTSFHVKASRDITLFKLEYMGQFLLVSGVLPLWILALASSLKPGAWSLKPEVAAFVRQRGPVLAGLALVFAYGSAHATVHMMFGYRLLLPYLPVLILIGVDLLDLAVGPGSSRHGRWRAAVAAFVALMLAVQTGQAVVVYSRSLGGFGITGEYRDVGLASYRSDFLPVMEAGCKDIRDHAATVRRFESRSPRFLTFAEGYIPYCFDSLYVFGHLMSFRHGINDYYPPDPEFQRSADYVYVLTPRHGTVAEQLVKPVDQYEKVSSRTIRYGATEETFEIYFNPSPENAALPSHVR